MTALDDFEEFEEFLYGKRDDGKLSEQELRAVIQEFETVTHAAGNRIDPRDPSLLPVFAQAVFRMKTKLLELHAEFADELRNLGGRGK